MMDLPRTVFLFSQLWLASMVALPPAIVIAHASNPAMQLASCPACGPAKKGKVVEARAPPGLMRVSHRVAS